MLSENAHQGGRWKIVQEWGGIPDFEKGIAWVARTAQVAAIARVAGIAHK